MSGRLLNTLSLISSVLLGCTTILWAWSSWADPCRDSLALSDTFHVAVYRGWVEFFPRKQDGPYRGGIIALDGDRIPLERYGFGDRFGICYRYIRRTDTGAVVWTVGASLLYPLAVFSMLPTIWGWKRWRAWRRIPTHDRVSGPRRQMLVAIRLYWWMGVLGIAAYSVAACAIGARLVFRFEPPSLENLGPLALCGTGIGVFWASIHTARRLDTKPAGMLPHARIVAIILATAWFPILTIPGIICLRRVTKNFAAYCEPGLP